MEYNFDNLTAFLDSIPEKYKVPGFDMKVIHHGKEVYRHMGGYADREKGTPITKDTHYFLYSCSKVFTCALALKAVEEGYFLPSEDVGKYLPEYYDVMLKEYDENGKMYLVKPARHIRIQDLFRMTSGFSYCLTNDEVTKVLKEKPNAPTRDIVRALAKNNIDIDPGTRFKYSISHDILACVVEVATGKRFRDYAKEKFLDPLGMSETSYGIVERVKDKMATLYVYKQKDDNSFPRELTNDYIFGPDYDSGGAGLVSTVDDYAKFITALSRFGVGENGVRILNKSTIDLMRTNILDLNSKMYQDFLDWGPCNAEYGYGYGVRTKIGTGNGGNFSSVGSFGWDGAAGGLIDIDPEREIAIVYLQHVINNPAPPIFQPKLRNLINIALGY